MATLQDFSLPVHKSFHQPNLLAGVPKIVFVILLLVTAGLIYFFGLPYALIGIVLYIPCFIISKRDPNLLEYALFSLFDIDYLEG
jgi:type IV secretory pathway VirB3-like protein